MQTIMNTESNPGYTLFQLNSLQILDFRANGWMKLENVIWAEKVQMLINDEAKTRMVEVTCTVEWNDPGKQFENAYRWYEVSNTCLQIKDIVAAFAPNFTTLLIARIVTGLTHVLFFSQD